MGIMPITEDYHSQGFIMSLSFSLLRETTSYSGIPPNSSKIPVMKQFSKSSDWSQVSSYPMKWVLGSKLDSVNPLNTYFVGAK